MKIHTIHGVMLAAALVHGHTQFAVAEEEGKSAEQLDNMAMVEGNHAFAGELYRVLAAGAEGGNLFFSPFSITSALGMTMEGADGVTAEEMRRVLHVPGGDGEAWGSARVHAAMGRLTSLFNQDGLPYELVVANALWGEQTMAFREAFLEAVQPNYDAKLDLLDFRGQPEAARERINTWVEEKTAKRIVDLLPEGSITGDTRLVLTNAIYFKAAWASSFQEGSTEDRDFHLGDGSTVSVPTMHQRGLRLGRHQAEGFQVLEIPYEGFSVVMTILLPDAADGLAVVEEAMTPQAWKEWENAMDWKSVHYYMPKFRVETEYTLNEALKEMGMPTAFEPGKADFSKISESAEGGELFISAVVHKAFIEVDEEGTEAAAATGVVIGLTSAPLDEPQDLRVDRPFVYAIRDRETGTLLFMGRVTDPR